MFETLLNPVFSPLLKLPPLVGIILVTLLVSLIITIVYKYMTDQTMMKDLKERQKEYQKKMKELRKDPEKLMKIQKQAMEVNMKYMTQSFKPTLITFLPIIIIFGWLNGNMAFEPIQPGQEFTATVEFNTGYSGNVTIAMPEGVTAVGEKTKEITDKKAEFKLKGTEGNYLLVFNHDGNNYDKELTITKEPRYAPVQKLFSKQPVRMITLGNNPLIVMNLAGADEGGWTKGRFGWLGTYIIFSIIFSMALRKVLKIY
jgi:uncharacterized membrane protein (DUF106 family)